MTSSERVEDAAHRLYRARIERTPIQPLSRQWLELDEASAYAVQEAVASLVAEPVVGFKLGYTSAAMRAQMKVDAPNYGCLFASTRAGDEGLIDSRELIHPLVEPEIAVVLAHDVTAEIQTREEALQAVDAVLPAMEIVDTRYEKYEFTAVDNIADNSSAARFVLGSPKAPAAIGDLRLLPAFLWRNGHTLAHGAGADVMDDPLLALTWFLRSRVRSGRSVLAGSVILTGGITAAVPAPRGSAFVAEFGPLGIAKCYFE
jgi:2-keto-4-pentenoate hydratase